MVRGGGWAINGVRAGQLSQHCPTSGPYSMSTVLLVVHLMIAIALVGVVLMQRSEGGALGMGGSGAGGGFLTGRGTANLLTRITAGLALGFFITSIGLTLLAKQTRAPGSMFDAKTGKPVSSAPAAPGQKEGGDGGGTGLLEKLKAGEGKARVPAIPQSK